MRWCWGVLGAWILTGSMGGCDPNVSGRLAARRFGAAPDVQVQRLSFDAEMRDACGEHGRAPSMAAELTRRPYLQRTQSDSLRIMWTGLADDACGVDVTRPGGEPVVSVESTVDLDAHPADARQHFADISGLESDQLYCYSIRSFDGTPLMGRAGFRTAPEPGSKVPLAFAAFGDSGYGGSDQAAVFAQLKTVRYDFVLHTGDVAYDAGERSELEEYFFDVYEPMLVSIPTFPVAGNHDYRSDAAAPFREVFSLPENGGEEGRERWYSFDWGQTHFVALDTQQVNEAQVRWLQADLERNALPWTIVYAHNGPYSSGAHGSNQAFRDAFGPLLEAHGVQLVISGHDHHYERTEPIDGTTYIVTGAGGRGTREPSVSSWTAFNLDVLHFVYVTIDGPDLRLHAIDATGQEFDFTHIVNPAASESL